MGTGDKARYLKVTNHPVNGDINISEELNHHSPLRLHSLVFNFTQKELFSPTFTQPQQYVLPIYTKA